jgi:hypothetical protein
MDKQAIAGAALKTLEAMRLIRDAETALGEAAEVLIRERMTIDQGTPYGRAFGQLDLVVSRTRLEAVNNMLYINEADWCELLAQAHVGVAEVSAIFDNGSTALRASAPQRENFQTEYQQVPA